MRRSRSQVQNFYLYFFGLLANALGMLVLDVISGESLGQVFRGLSGWVLLLVMVNAAQGVLASFFYKFADTILKKYSICSRDHFHRCVFASLRSCQPS